MIRAGLLYGLIVAAGFLGAALLLGAGGCYDTTVKAPPCTVGGEGCLPLVHDAKKPDGGR